MLALCETVRTKRSGPGGQNRNKVETAIVLKHRATGIVAEASERRNQAENLRVAVFRLRVRLALEARRPVALAPSPLWKSRCARGRIAVNPTHRDFPALLAEALDTIASTEFDPKRAAELLECSSTQLIKFLKLEPRAFRSINERRAELGLRVLL